MPIEAQLNHIAFLVPSVQRAALLPSQLGFHLGPAERFDGEGTLEIYVGDPSLSGRLLLTEPSKDGPYLRAMRKRGPGLHHIAIDVLNLETFILNLAGSGWLLHPKSLETIKHARTAYLARPGVPTLIEIHEREELSECPRFISKFEVSVDVEQMRLFQELGVDAIAQSCDTRHWLTCARERFSANHLWV